MQIVFVRGELFSRKFKTPLSRERRLSERKKLYSFFSTRGITFCSVVPLRHGTSCNSVPTFTATTSIHPRKRSKQHHRYSLRSFSRDSRSKRLERPVISPRVVAWRARFYLRFVTVGGINEGTRANEPRLELEAETRGRKVFPR